MEQMEQQEQNKFSHAPEQSSVRDFAFWKFTEKNFLALSILVAGVMISGSFLYANSASIKNDTAQIPTGNKEVVAEVSMDDDAVLGNKNAKVTIIEFSDFQCPFCRVFWRNTLSQIKKEYIDTGKVKFVYRDFPLSFHSMAEPSARAAQCARDQNKYWEMHDKILVSRTSWDREQLLILFRI